MSVGVPFRIGMSLLAALAGSLAPAADQSAVIAAYEKEIVPILKANCYACHGPDKQKGDLNLAVYRSGEAAVKARKVWKQAGENVLTKDMPPEKEKIQPSDAERAKILAWIKALRESEPPDAGRVTVRRLNRLEYNNTIRDLVGVDIKPAAEFPEDDVGDGFDNIGEVLSLPPLLMEKYIIAADQILDKATITEQCVFHAEAEDWKTMEDGKEKAPATPAADEPKAKGPAGATLVTASEVRGFFNFPADGRYTFKIKAGADQAGNEPASLGLKVDDKLMKDGKVTATKTGPGVVSFAVDVKRGMRAISVAFLNPFEEAPLPPPSDKPGTAKPPAAAVPPRPAGPAKPPAKPRVRSVLVDCIDVTGPPTPSMPETHRKIFFVKPDQKLSKTDAAKQIISRFASRAYRRPVSDAQLERLMKLFEVAEKNGQVFEESVRLALKGVLISPSFLFRAEPDRPTKDANGAYALDNYEIASRLSYFLWSSMPDEALFEQAKQGKLTEPSVLAQETQRLLKDPKARALVDSFGGQWLKLNKINYIEPDLKIFPEFTPEMRKALYDETATYFEMIMREDRSVLEFIDSDYAYLNDKLAKLYGIPGVNGPNLRKVQLTDRNRGGLLGQGAILAITSMPTRTSPVKRGKWVLEQLLNDPPPPPPPMVEALEKQSDTAEVHNLSLRAKMERHRTDPVCNSCHKVMDAIGFGLENFDAMGRWREKDGNGNALDTAGKMPSGAGFRSPSELKGVFMSNKDKFARCVTEKMLTYALGRGMEYYDEATVDKIAKSLEQNGYRFSVLVTEITRSYPFLYRRSH
jgi:mono/diheme cytochrome c family protein